MTAVLAAMCVAAAPAQAGGGSVLGCGHAASHPFLPWLDPLPYTLLPNGDFEAGGRGWSLSGGAKVATGNHPFASGARSLVLPSGSSAVSPAMCMELVLPVVRFFSTGGSALSYLQVDALYTDSSGRRQSVTLAPLGLPSASWGPNLQMLQAGGTLNAATLNGLTTDVQLRLTPRGGLFGSGTWRVDDIYVDPWKTV